VAANKNDCSISAWFTMDGNGFSLQWSRRLPGPLSRCAILERRDRQRAIEEMPMNGPNPAERYPLGQITQLGFLKNFITRENIVVGDYTYYDDPEGPGRFENNVLYHFPFVGDKLIIGKYGAIAKDVRFIMNGANHKTAGFSTYPFWIFKRGWESAQPEVGELPYKGDTVIGNDVWLGYDALIMPGVKIGHGAIVASRAVVTTRVAPYAIVAGNPAQELMRRYPEETIRRLLKIAWWDWPVEKVTRHLPLIVGADIDALERAE
jgi:virginiamycin A acetyltransferase